MTTRPSPPLALTRIETRVLIDELRRRGVAQRAHATVDENWYHFIPVEGPWVGWIMEEDERVDLPIDLPEDQRARVDGMTSHPTLEGYHRPYPSLPGRCVVCGNLTPWIFEGEYREPKHESGASDE